MINKSRGNANEWYVFGYPNNSAFSADGSNLKLNSSVAIVNSTVHEVSLDSSVITFVDSGHPNFSGDDIIAYCFHSIEGYSKFGSYTGNGSADGTFVYLGFRPAFIILKRTDSTGNWTMYDSARSTYNPSTRVLYPNLSNTEDASTDHFDWLSNGFKMKSTNQNTSGGTFIFMAFAEHPFKHSLAQ
jgi:hypothetical protein